MAGLLVVEFFEESGGEGSVFSDECGGFIVLSSGQGRRVDGWVGVS